MQGVTASAHATSTLLNVNSAVVASKSHDGRSGSLRKALPTSWCSNLSAKSSSHNGTAVVDLRRHSPSVDVSQQHAPGQAVASILGDLFPTTQTTTNNVVLNGRLVLSKKSILDIANVGANFLDSTFDLLQQQINMQLVSVNLDSGGKLKVSSKSALKASTSTGYFGFGASIAAGDEEYTVSFTVPADFGEVGAFKIWNPHVNEFYLQSFTLELPNKDTVQFPCNSWVFNVLYYSTDRVFFSNKFYLPDKTPAGLKDLRESELKVLKGNGTGNRGNADRIYDYDIYNDLGKPDLVPSTQRTPLGGSKDLPYPRRIRTGRGKSFRDPKSETGMPNFGDLTYFIPPDEKFSREKGSGFLAVGLKSIVQGLVPIVTANFDQTPNNWDSYKQIEALYTKGLDLAGAAQEKPDVVKEDKPFVFMDAIFGSNSQGSSLKKYPLPQIIGDNDVAWLSDEEYGRQTLAGVNPVVIRQVKEFPPKSALDPKVYGTGTALTENHIKPFLEGKTVAEAITAKRLFTIDYHDAFLPYITRINALSGSKSYAPRSIFYYTDGGKMMPVAIELSLPPPAAGKDAINRVLTPYVKAEDNDHTWELAKLFANSVDFNYHEVYIHFTQCHAAMEPIIISSNRNLSRLHPIFTLLLPTSKNTLMINSVAREMLISGEGVIEQTCIPGKYAMEISSKVYGGVWRFDQQALPADLIARGMAEPADASYPGGVKLVIGDYPFATDALEIWEASKTYISKYVNIVYNSSDAAVKDDKELQAWWNEIINVGHGDKKDESWWPKLNSVASLIDVLTTISWIAGPHHAAVNFGQYAYGGFYPNKPSITRRFLPEKGSQEYNDLQANPEKFKLTVISSQTTSVLLMTVFELLSTHAVDEEYIGDRLNSNWTSDPKVQAAFKEYNSSLRDIENKQKQRNADASLANRNGPAKVPYTLLYPSSPTGLTGKGIPGSISI